MLRHDLIPRLPILLYALPFPARSMGSSCRMTLRAAFGRHSGGIRAALTHPAPAIGDHSQIIRSASAARFSMPYYEGLLHYHLGRYLPPSDPARHHHLTQAHTIFTELRASYDLVRTEELLAIAG